jgi:hypothetical protein
MVSREARRIVQMDADLIAQLPTGEFTRKNLDCEHQQERIDRWYNSGILEQLERATNAGNSQATWRVKQIHRELAEERVEKRDPSETWPCDHPGTNHTDDGHQCGKDWCDDVFDREQFGTGGDDR